MLKTMKIQIFELLTLFGILFASCNKEPNHHTIVEGRVLERYAKTPTPIPNAQVRLLSNRSVILSNAAPNTSDEVLADAQGNYRMEYDADPGSWYEVVAYPVKDPKRQYYEGISVSIPNYGLNKIDCFLSPYAYLRMHIKNISPKNSSDYISLGGGIHDAGPFLGAYVDTTFIKKISGNERVSITWFITKNNVNTVKFDSIVCPAHDTLPYEVLY
jgi:hypothetical protein